MSESQGSTPSTRCRVCGLDQRFDPWEGGYGSSEICVCCGTEFGYEDGLPQAAKRARRRWLERGATWFRPSERPPDWSLDEQLRHIPVGFRDVDPDVDPMDRVRARLRAMSDEELERARLEAQVAGRPLSPDLDPRLPSD